MAKRATPRRVEVGPQETDDETDDQLDAAAETPAALPADHPALHILRFLNCFEPGSLRLNRMPPKRLLEHLANCFKEWLEHKGVTLEGAFGLKGSGRGRATPKEQMRAELKRYVVKATYHSFRDDNPAEIAEAKTVEKLRGQLWLTDTAIRDIIHRKAPRATRRRATKNTVT